MFEMRLSGSDDSVKGRTWASAKAKAITEAKRELRNMHGNRATRSKARRLVIRIIERLADCDGEDVATVEIDTRDARRFFIHEY